MDFHPESVDFHQNSKGTTVYMNSGDWVENLSALEHSNGKWSLYTYPFGKLDAENSKEEDDIIEFTPEELLEDIVEVRSKSA